MPIFGFHVKAHEVIDGDSVRVWIARGWGATKKVICRLHGIAPPELRSSRGGLEREAAAKVKEFVIRWLAQVFELGGSALYDRMETDSLDKGVWFGRYWGDLFLVSDGARSPGLASILLDNGLAVSYSGGPRSWENDQLANIIEVADEQILRFETD